MKSKTSRIILILLLVLLLLVFGTAAAGAIAKSNLARQYPAPGRSVDVGGHKMHINCSGQGSPTVILEAGTGLYSLDWTLVQPEVARFTRVCSYDRAGYGWSEASPRPRTADSQVEELHRLLINAGINGPYVLVGHSLGGMLVRMYAHNYPDDVSGMVLVDSFHEERPIRNPELLKLNQDQAGQFRLLGLMSSTGLMALMPQSIPNPGYPKTEYAQYQAMTATTGYFETFVAEILTLEESSAMVRALQIDSLGNLPLIVLSPGIGETVASFSDKENQELRQEMQAQQLRLAALSTQSKQMIAEHSGHFIQIDQPELVTEAVQEIVDTIRQ